MNRSGPLTDSEATSFVTTKSGERKFIGGAAMARLNANRRPLASNKKSSATRILRPDEIQKSMQSIPSGLSSFETFFAALLRSVVSEYLPHIERCGKRTATNRQTLETICHRLSLPPPVKPLASCYSSIKDHFSHRGVLVLEEARFAIEEGLRRTKQDFSQRRSSCLSNGAKRGARKFDRNQNGYVMSSITSHGGNMVLKLTGVEVKERSGHSILTFLKESGPFTRDEMQSLRHGTVFACHDRVLEPNIANSVLGCVVPQSREDMVTIHSFAIMIFKRIKKSSVGVWDLTPIASLLSEQRKFDACMGQIAKPVSFIFPLLGTKEASHVKFHEDENGKTYAVDVESHDDAFSGNDSDSDCQLLEFGGQENAFVLPRLNEMQEKAAKSFLSAKKDTITLIQG
jgi:hypothetical protein